MLKSGEPERLRLRSLCGLRRRYPTTSDGLTGQAARDRVSPIGHERRQVTSDYTGGSIYAESQVQKHFRLLRSGVLKSALRQSDFGAMTEM